MSLVIKQFLVTELNINFQMTFTWADDSLNNVNPNISLDQFSETIIFESS